MSQICGGMDRHKPIQGDKGTNLPTIFPLSRNSNLVFSLQFFLSTPSSTLQLIQIEYYSHPFHTLPYSTSHHLHYSSSGLVFGHNPLLFSINQSIIFIILFYDNYTYFYVDPNKFTCYLIQLLIVLFIYLLLWTTSF